MYKPNNSESVNIALLHNFDRFFGHRSQTPIEISLMKPLRNSCFLRGRFVKRVISVLFLFNKHIDRFDWN